MSVGQVEKRVSERRHRGPNPTPTQGGRVVLCSDGVWDAISPEEVAHLNPNPNPNPTFLPTYLPAYLPTYLPTDLLV